MYPPGMFMPGMFGGGTSEPYQPAQEDDVKRRIKKLQAANTIVKDKVRIIHEFNSEAGYGQLAREFIAAGGIKVLVKIACDNWPDNGDLRKSAAEQDVVAIITPNAHHSMRRCAIGCLANMGNYEPLCNAMADEGLITHLPRMLRSTVSQYRWGQTYDEMYGNGPDTDQVQYIGNRLLSLCAGILQVREPFRTQLIETVAPVVGEVGKVYSRPDGTSYAELGGPGPKAGPRPRRHKAPANRRKKQANSSEEPEDEFEKMLHKMGVDEDEGDSMRMQTFIHGGNDMASTDWLRFFANVLQIVKPGSDIANMLIDDRMMLMFKAKNMPGEAQAAGYKEMVASLGYKLYHPKALADAPRLRKAQEEAMAKGMELRHQGNDAFKTGDLERAHALYTEALKSRWDDGALLCNRSLVRLLQGRADAAARDGEAAVLVEPRNGKAWARWGDALRAKGWHRAALMAYRHALTLYAKSDTAARTDVQERVTQEQQAIQGAQQSEWLEEEVACPTFTGLFDENMRKWLQLPKRKARPGRACREEDQALANAEIQKSCKERLCALAVKGALLTSRAMADARRADEIPGCYVISWTDKPRRCQSTGLPYFFLHTMDISSGAQRGAMWVQGTPRLPAMLALIAMSIAAPRAGTGPPGKPNGGIFLAHRGAPWFDLVNKEARERWGVTVEVESRPEAIFTAKTRGNDPDGLNNKGMYVDENEDGPYEPSSHHMLFSASFK